MTYSIEMTPTAEKELYSAFEYIYARAPRNAVRRLQNIRKAIHSLQKMPNRCALAPESEHLGDPLRHYLFKSHRIIFFVDENAKCVRILYVRHGKMRAVGEEDSGDQ